VVEKHRKFGETLGMAFQIKDDLFDYETSAKTGKPSGIDIKEQKMTLPLIYALIHASKKEKRRIIGIIKNHHDEPAKVQEVMQYVIGSGGIEYAEEKMNAYKLEAISYLDDVPEGPSKTALLELVDYVITRKK
jgi:octaprenyl-diphosphate synthase